MAFEDVLVKFENFEPSDEVRIGFDQLVKVVYAESPSGCFVKANLKKVGTQYQGSIEVSFTGGKFEAYAEHTEFKVVRIQLGEQVRFKIQDWRRSHSAHTTAI
jgi:hypothetical protein